MYKCWRTHQVSGEDLIGAATKVLKVSRGSKKQLNKTWWPREYVQESIRKRKDPKKMYDYSDT